VLDSTQGVLFIRNGKTLVHLINLHCPMAVRQHGKGRFDIICASRAYELEAPDADEARRWVSALLPFTVGGRDGATAAADERGSFTRMITGNAHTGLRMWVGDLENCCDTGDLILFSTKDGGASAIRFFTGSVRDLALGRRSIHSLRRHLWYRSGIMWASSSELLRAH